ncbi:MAG: hypothetical protein KBC41_02495 [Candidatus Pacebacteria bacterium]|nr:hypothetical protein [Candidatus Paceibacterota bacterium]MBP9866924.1 hypothetical protein [Candidatus Paceibacterota bacterium]
MSQETFTVKLDIHDNLLKSLSVNEDGIVTFTEGDKKECEQVSCDAIEDLKRYILEKDFFSLEEKYLGTECCDFVAHTVTVSIGEKTHTVYCYNTCPIYFDEIVKKIKNLWPRTIEYTGFS